MASLPRPFLPVQPASPSLDSLEIEPTQMSYPRLRVQNQKLVERRREETFADIIKLVRQSPASPVFTGTPGTCPSTRGNKSCYFTEPTDDTDEIVSPRQPPSVVLRPSEHGRRHHSHHKSCANVRPFAYSLQQPERVRHVSFDSSILHLEATLRGHRNTVTALEFLGPALVSASSDYTLKMWQLSEDRFQVRAECVFSTYAHKSKIKHLAVQSDHSLCSVGEEPFCYLWSLKPLKLKKRSKIPLSTSPSSLLCPSPLTLLSGSPTGLIFVTSIEEAVGAAEYRGHCGAVTDLESVGTNTFLSASFDASIRLWDFRTKESVTVMREHRDTVNRVLQWDEYAFFSAGEDCCVKVGCM